MRVEIPIVNAFVDGAEGGNPAGVVLNAQEYSQEQKQRIAGAIGLSETAFVSPSSVADFKLEFFTPTRQIAHCGHATIATFCYLQQSAAFSGDHTSKETIDGRREILMEGSAAYMQQIAPQYTELSAAHQLRAIDSLGLKPSDLSAGALPCVVNTGNSFLLVCLVSSDVVRSVEPNMQLISTMSEEYDLIGFYIFSADVERSGRDAGARMFAPRYGIDEESATGMAAGPLACYLYDKLENRSNHFLIEQGHLMSQPSPSVISVRLNTQAGFIVSLMAGGKAAVSEIKYVEI